MCLLCRHTPKSAKHLLAECRYSQRIWATIAAWTSIDALSPTTWPPSESVEQWWITLAGQAGVAQKALQSLVILVTWELWNERNARVFRHKELPVNSLVAKIKEEARIWAVAGAKHICAELPFL
uniref:Reverse transcriptase zinc-binding domain-containing protein n=1 Tax=Arundo donax TaxID=35708 RepID=A0A0A9BUB0_ARUDO